LVVFFPADSRRNKNGTPPKEKKREKRGIGRVLALRPASVVCACRAIFFQVVQAVWVGVEEQGGKKELSAGRKKKKKRKKDPADTPPLLRFESFGLELVSVLG